MYLAIAGSQIEGYKQGLKYVIKDQEIYDLHYKEWLPQVGYTVTEEKKLMSIIIESQRKNIVFDWNYPNYQFGDNNEQIWTKRDQKMDDPGWILQKGPSNPG
ncbi:MAG: hypothetical protein EZS28_020886 [Streblomastix strix]|uniref:Uncharacterized protein n=1 Tax=Streblomastix strix TaxID=222440 RepID=A0A5J4VLV2_9EUKA|nr:MAG: hypothetical protein EZS28_020886 [Streblomastix strix]